MAALFGKLHHIKGFDRIDNGMNKNEHTFHPDIKNVGLICVIIFLSILINLYLNRTNFSIIIAISLFLQVIALIFMLMPILRNQKIIINGNEICIFSFGVKNTLYFKNNLKEVVIDDDEIVSYRFADNRGLYQVSPNAYCERLELRNVLLSLFEKNKVIVSVIEK